MGRTLPSSRYIFLKEQKALSQFRGALSPRDQKAFDDLFIMAQKHNAELGFAVNILPLEGMFLAMILEEHKEVIQLRQIMEDKLRE
jgi:hypothetical protein